MTEQRAGYTIYMKPELGDLLREDAFQRVVLYVATLCGWAYYHTHDSRRSPAGFPDLVFCRPPQLIYAELKTNRGRVRPEQQRWLDLLRSCDATVYLWRPSDWKSIIEVLNDGRIAAE